MVEASYSRAWITLLPALPSSLPLFCPPPLFCCLEVFWPWSVGAAPVPAEDCLMWPLHQWHSSVKASPMAAEVGQGREGEEWGSFQTGWGWERRQIWMDKWYSQMPLSCSHLEGDPIGNSPFPVSTPCYTPETYACEIARVDLRSPMLMVETFPG